MSVQNRDVQEQRVVTSKQWLGAATTSGDGYVFERGKREVERAVGIQTRRESKSERYEKAI